jgi:hypothetical protein
MAGDRINVFLAHNKGDSDVRLAHLEEVLIILHPQFDLHITRGFVDWQKNFARFGTWEAWINNIVEGRAFGSTFYNYDAVVVPNVEVGKATAGIIRLCLEKQKPCKYFDGLALHRIVTCRTEDAQNYQAGWKVVFE